MRIFSVFILSVIFFLQCKNLKTTDPDDSNNTAQIFLDLPVKDFISKWHQAPKGSMLLDLRTPPEFDGGSIKGSVLINYLESDIDQELQKLDKNQEYYIFCQQSGRSLKCKEKMKTMGFAKVFLLQGGYEEYLKIMK